MAASVVASMSGCEEETFYMIMEENNQYVLHVDTPDNKDPLGMYDCGIHNPYDKRSVVYSSMPPEHAYNIKCSGCFPQQ